MSFKSIIPTKWMDNVMNYMFYIRYQTYRYILTILTAALAYAISCHFGWRAPIIVSEGHIGAFISGSLTFIFFGAYLTAKQNQSNK